MRARLARASRGWIAAALVVLAAVAIMLAGSASGASSSTVVGATVPSSTTISLAGCSTPAELQLGSLSVAATATTSTCRVDFGANTSAGLRLFQKDRSGAAMTQVRSQLDTRSGVPLFRSVDVLDANTVWLGGSRLNVSDPTPLKYTTDGGTTWTDVTPCATISSTVSQIVAWSASEVLIMTSNRACHTTDAGVSWTQVTTPHSVGNRVSTVPGTNVVWATTGSNGRIMRSTDRGLTWSSITVPGATTGFSNLVNWGTDDAVATSTVTAGDNLSRTAYAWKTTNAGATWTQHTIDTIAVTTVPATTGSLSLLDRSSVSGRIVASGSWSQGNRFQRYYSDDGGVTWTTLPAPAFTDKLRYLGGSTWMGGNRLATAYVSTDDGITWTSYNIGGGGSEFLHHISPQRGGAVVVVGDSSGVYRSTTSGTTWASISPVYTSYNAVVSFDSSRIAVVAMDGSALRSSDAGVTMVAATGCGGSGYRDAVATGPTSAVVVGSGGAVCRTTDAGATWTSVPSGIGSTLTEVVRVPRDGTLIAHGSSAATFIRSTDGGATWSAMPLSIAGTVGLLAVDEDGSTMALSRASAGQLWVSTDGGVNWVARDDGLTSSLQSIAVSPSGSRILTGHYPLAADGFNRISTSTDSGATWTDAPVGGGGGEVLGLSFTSETRVWALAGNRIHVSDDAAVTFTQVGSSPSTADKLEVLDANTVLVSGIGKLLAVSRPTVSVPDVSVGTGLTAAGGAFGACLLGTTNAAPAWPSSGACAVGDPTPWRPAVADSTAPGALVATTAGGTSSADVVFGLRSGSTQASGSYQAHLIFEVVAP